VKPLTFKDEPYAGETPVSPFSGLAHGGYGVIHADPAWTFLTRSAKGKGRSAEMHYDCLTIADIKRLPVADLAAPKCALFMWITDPMLPIGLEVIEAWGFDYATVGFYWEKLNKDGSPFTGMGYYTRANPEQCLLATRGGSPKRLDKGVPRLIRSPRREHSRKPEETYRRIERLFGGAEHHRHVDLFSREDRPGWDHWGHETGKFPHQPPVPGLIPA
jgi:N6-adenosine-specific RNA methylase IME4